MLNAKKTFIVSHRGTRGKKKIVAVDEDAAIEAFREKHGKIQSVHGYVVLPAGPPASTVSDAPEASVVKTPKEPKVEEPKVEEPSDPTLADMGIDGEAAELLTGAGLLTRSQVVTFAEANEGLTSIHGIGESRENDIRNAIQDSK
jgi:hypothetical protein